MLSTIKRHIHSVVAIVLLAAAFITSPFSYGQTTGVTFGESARGNTTLIIPGKGVIELSQGVDFPQIVFEHSYLGTTLYVFNGSNGVACEDNFWVIIARPDRYDANRIDGCYLPAHSFGVIEPGKVRLVFEGQVMEYNLHTQ